MIDRRRHPSTGLCAAGRGPCVIFALLVSLGAPSRAQTPERLPATVREVIIRGNVRTQPQIILREMGLRPGVRLSDEGLLRDRERVYNLQLFNRVDVDAHQRGDSADVYVTVDERWYIYPYPVFDLVHRDPKKLVYGVGVTHQNLAGLNQKLFFEGVLGYDQWAMGTYRNPRFLGMEDLSFQGKVGYFDQHPLSRDSAVEYRQVAAVAGSSVGKRFGFYESVTAGAGIELWDVPLPALPLRQAGDGAVHRTASSNGRDLFLTAYVQYVFDRRNLREYPTEGAFFSAVLSKDGFGESQVNLTHIGMDARRYDPVIDDLVLASRVYGRWTNGGVVPTYRHVFFGYEERLRGSFLTVREGERQVGGNLELRFPLLSPRYYEARFIPMPQFSVLRYGLYLGLFVDAGAVWYRTQSFASAPWAGGAGAGLHFILPYGLTVRTEWAVDRTGNGELVLDVGASF